MSSDFIGFYDNAFDKNYCDEVISFFDKAEEQGFTLTRNQTDNVIKNVKDGTSINSGLLIESADSSYILERMLPQIGGKFNEVLSHKLQEYAYDFSILVDDSATDPLFNYACKCQKTNIGEGYHVWHHESGSRSTCGRALMYILYLNDVEEGGETEFLYYHKRIKPKAGTLIIAPAGFTHTHRGNPPLSNTKYILTGWLEY